MSSEEAPMDVVMLAAGTSSRMGRTNKMLLPYNGMSMVCHCCLQALKFLQNYSDKTGEKCTLIVVTGYRSASVQKALQPCKAFIEKTDARLEMLIIENKDYRKGQFSSAKTGVAQVQESSAFFISLADMPLVRADNYEVLVPLLEDHDAVRPFCLQDGNSIPGHPVLHAYRLKDIITKCPDDWTVSRILKKADVIEKLFNDSAFFRDIDSLQDFQSIS